MRSLSEHGLLAARVPERLAELLGVALADLDVRKEDPSGADLVITGANQIFIIEVNKSTGAAPIAAACKKVLEIAKQFRKRVIPLLVVPFMGETGRLICKDAGVGWIDLSGNANIVAPGIRVIIDGRANLFRTAGRPRNTFAPKSARVVRWLLIHLFEPLTQRQIARATDMTEGFVSRIISQLEKDDYLVRDKNGAVTPKNPALLLDEWRESYQFSKHTIYQGYVAARSGEALLQFVDDKLSEKKIEHAATGLAGAWAMTHFAAFRIATFYLSTAPSPTLLQELEYREDPRGSNLWLVVPNDKGVFHGAEKKDGIRCVHPVQVYVDLKGHPERSTEAAEHLRTELLTWRHDG